MSVFDLISHEHGVLLDLLLWPEKHHDAPSAERLSWYTSVARAWHRHAEGEERWLYPRLEQIPESKLLARAALAEHEFIHKLFMELDSIPADDERWVPDFEDLRERIRLHVDEEEAVLFKKMRKVLSPGELSSIAHEASGTKAA